MSCFAEPQSLLHSLTNKGGEFFGGSEGLGFLWDVGFRVSGLGSLLLVFLFVFGLFFVEAEKPLDTIVPACSIGQALFPVYSNEQDHSTSLGFRQETSCLVLVSGGPLGF